MMALGDYNGPDKPDKGDEGGSCTQASLSSCMAGHDQLRNPYDERESAIVHPMDYKNHGGAMDKYREQMEEDIAKALFIEPKYLGRAKIQKG